jgi:ribose-phosphate pyrophosphokinase
MSRSLLLPMPGNEAFAAQLAEHLDAVVGSVTVRRFPDGESYVRIHSDVANRQVAIVCTLHKPDPQFLSLLFAARESQALGATRVGLIAPYLSYLRQDKRFNAGEALTSAYFAQVLSSCFSWLVTVDPHLHRLASLADIYSLDSVVLHAAKKLGVWIRDNVKSPKLIGPDDESRQWVSVVAQVAKADFVVLEKTRYGDRDVRVRLPDVGDWRTVTPVLVDDIVSSAHTMIAVLKQWPHAHSSRPICVAVHAVFAEGAYRELLAAEPARVVTTNSIPHESNLIDIAALVADGVRQSVSSESRRREGS